MATTFTLVPIPLWYLADATGKPFVGSMEARRSIDKITQKAFFVDSGGTIPWANPVNWLSNGESPGPFFWANDELYFLIFYSGVNGTGTIIATVDGYGPGVAGGGGGGAITNNNLINNFVVNNLFLNHGGTTSTSGTTLDTFTNIQSGTIIAPSNHRGLVYGASASPAFSTMPFVGPDVIFTRSNDTATDKLVFQTTDFAAGTNPLTGDVTPEFYIDLSCSVTGTETLKAIQWPIDLRVKNLEGQVVTGMVWAKGNSGTINLVMNLVQYFGQGSAQAPVITPIPIAASPLKNSWDIYKGTLTGGIPLTNGKTLGTGQDDATYLQLVFPSGALFDISFTKPKLYLGTVGSVFPELQTYDEVARTINSPRTGDIRIGLNTFGNSATTQGAFGWLPMNDQTIGSASSGATRASNDTWPLYATLWLNVLNDWAPVTGGRTAGSTIDKAYADFNANKPMALTKALGRVLGNIGLASGAGNVTTWALGQNGGVETHAVTTNELPSHNHGLFGAQDTAGGAHYPSTTGSVRAFQSPSDSIGNTGGGAAMSLVQASTFMNVYIKL